MGRRLDTGATVATTHRNESLRDVVRDVVRAETSARTTVLEDAVARLQVQLQQTRTCLEATETRLEASERLYSGGLLVDMAYSEILRGQLTVLNDGTQAFIASLDARGRAALERQLRRPLREGDDFYTLCRSQDALLQDGRPINRALCAGEDELGRMYEAARSELSWRGEGQTFAPMLASDTLWRVVGGPVSQLLVTRNDVGHPLERGRPQDVEALLGDMPVKIANGDPMYTKGQEMDLMLVVGATMGKACLRKFGQFSSVRYRDLDQPNPPPAG